MSKKRHRERPAVDTQLAEIYEDLAHVDERIRLKAAHALIANFTVKNKITGGQFLEILQRLFRGLCSGRKAARLGFSVALAEFLNALTGLELTTKAADVQKIVSLYSTSTQVSNDADGQESRDHYLGRLFGADAIIKSGILFREHVGSDPWTSIIDEVCILAKKKSWLREQCGFVLYEAVLRLVSEDGGSSHLSSLVDKLRSHALLRTPEGIAIWIQIKSNNPSYSFPKGIWHRNTPLNRKELPRLVSIFNETVNQTDESETDPEIPLMQKGFWNPKIHFVWSILLKALRSGPDNESSTLHSDEDRVPFHDFWSGCVDDGLLKPSSSKERKYWGFLVFQEALHSMSTPTEIQTIFSHNLLRCFRDSLSSSERYLHSVAEKVARSITAKASTDPKSRLSLLETLLLPANRSIAHDLMSLTKIYEDLLAGARQISDQNLMVKKIDSLITGTTSESAKNLEERRRKLADLLAKSIKQISTNQAKDEKGSNEEPLDEFVIALLILLATHACFKTSAGDNEDGSRGHMSSETRNHFTTRLMASINDIVNKSPNAARQLMGLMKFLQEDYHNAWNIDELVLDTAGFAEETLDRAWSNLQSIDTNTQDRNSSMAQAVSLMISSICLQVLHGDSDALNMLGDVNETFSPEKLRLYSEQSIKLPSSGVDLITGITTLPYPVYRQIAHRAFDAFSTVMDEASLSPLYNILETPENLAGQKELFEEGEAETADEDEGSSVGSDVELEEASGLLNGKEDVSGASSASGSTSSQASDSEVVEGEEDDSDEELALFDAKLAQALRTRKGDDDLDGHDDDDSSSASSMNDEQMEALDTHLEAVFRERKNAASTPASKKKENQNAKENIVNFKCRVLEFLQIFVKRTLDKPISLTVLVPVLALLRTTSNPVLIKQTSNLIREFSQICKANTSTQPKKKKNKKKNHNQNQNQANTKPDNPNSAPAPSIPQLSTPSDIQQALKILESIHKEARLGTGSNAHATACSQASLILVKVLARNDNNDNDDNHGSGANLRKVVAVYAQTQASMLLDERCGVKVGFFTDWLNWCGSWRQGMKMRKEKRR